MVQFGEIQTVETGTTRFSSSDSEYESSYLLSSEFSSLRSIDQPTDGSHMAMVERRKSFTAALAQSPPQNTTTSSSSRNEPEVNTRDAKFSRSQSENSLGSVSSMSGADVVKNWKDKPHLQSMGAKERGHSGVALKRKPVDRGHQQVALSIEESSVDVHFRHRHDAFTSSSSMSSSSVSASMMTATPSASSRAISASSQSNSSRSSSRLRTDSTDSSAPVARAASRTSTLSKATSLTTISSVERTPYNCQSARVVPQGR